MSILRTESRFIKRKGYQRANAKSRLKNCTKTEFRCLAYARGTAYMVHKHVHPIYPPCEAAALHLDRFTVKRKRTCED